MARLLIQTGSLAGQAFAVEQQLTIGRENADLTLADPEVSRRHAVVRRDGGALLVEDLGSLNGTWVNGHRVSAPADLAAGDVLRVGATEIHVELVSPPVDIEDQTVAHAPAPDRTGFAAAASPPTASPEPPVALEPAPPAPQGAEPAHPAGVPPAGPPPGPPAGVPPAGPPPGPPAAVPPAEPPPGPPGAPSAQPEAPPGFTATRPRRPATRGTAAMAVTFVVIVATAAALIAYFALRTG